MKISLDPDLPNFFIIGAAKAGTTTLYDTLLQHPGVFLPFDKEPAFFCDDEYYAKGVGWYLNTYYKLARSKQMRGDSTPRYLYWGSKVVPRLKTIYGNDFPYVIVIFRDPVALVNSYYWHSVREGRETLRLVDALASEEQRLVEHGDFLRRRGRLTYCYSRIGRYAEQLIPYMKYLPRNNFLFLLTDDLKKPSEVMAKIEGFLNLEHNDKVVSLNSNSASLPRSHRMHQWLRKPSSFKNIIKLVVPVAMRHRVKNWAIDINLKSFTIPPLDPDISAHLRQIYRNEIVQLQETIGRDLSSWL